MATQKDKGKSKFPAAPTYDIKIPRSLPKLDGTFTRKERVAVAMDVLALLRLRSRSRTFVLASNYFDPDSVPESGQLHSSVIRGECYICARGMMFLASVDRFDRCDLASLDGGFTYETISRTQLEWGIDQAELIEGAFEDGHQGVDSPATRAFHEKHTAKNGNRKPLMRAIAQNIIANHGEFKPEDVDA